MDSTLPSDSESKLQYFVTDHAAERATERLGTMPTLAWWRDIAQRIRDRTAHARRYQRKGDRETCAYVFKAANEHGDEVDLIVVASSKLADGRARTVWFITIYVDGEE